MQTAQNRIALFARALTRPHILFFALPWLMVLTVLGTLAQKDMGLYAAQKMFFSSLILWAGPVPLPGGLATIALITLNLCCKFVFATRWSWPRAGSHIVHLGVIVLLLGGLMTAATMKEGYMILPEGHESADVYGYDEARQEVMIHKPPLFTLPFVLRLEDFEKSYHPATDIPKAFASDLVIKEGALNWPARIEMNKPLRYKGYTVFQSSFDDKNGVEVSVLSVVWNAGRLFPYAASAIIAAGLLLHILLRLKKGRA